MTEKFYRIVVDSDDADRKVNKFDQRMRETGRTADNNTFKMNKLASAIKGALVGGALAAATKAIIQVQREFDKLNASLVTATGSQQNAAKAFGAIEKLASETPYSVNQVTEAFVKLRNLGLDPSEGAIVSFGNTASAMGKDLMQFIEAVADASTGEFERLKEFGIKARNEGNEIAFTFQGTTTRIQNNADAIQKYLRDIGDNNFAGAMSERMKTLDGALSNLGDSWDKFVRGVSQSGIGDGIASAVRVAISALDRLSVMINSGELLGYFEAIKASLRGVAFDAKFFVDSVVKSFNELSFSAQGSGSDIKEFLGGAFLNIVPNIRALIQILTVEVVAAIDKVTSYAGFLKEALTTLDFGEANKNLTAQIDGINQARLSSIDTIIAEKNAAIESTEKQIEGAQRLRSEYEKNKQAQSDNVLSEFAIKPTGEGAGQDAGKKKDISGAIARVQLETDLISKNLAHRVQMYQEYGSILNSVNADQLVIRKAQLEKSIADEVFAEEQNFLAKTERIAIQQAQIAENKNIADSQRLEMINALHAQEEEITALHEQKLTEIKSEGDSARQHLDKVAFDQRISMAQGAFSSLISLTQGHTKKGFEIAKAGSKAVATAKGIEAATDAWAAGMSTGGPWAPVVAAGFTAASLLKTGAQIKQLNAVKFNGGGGGHVGGGGGRVSIPNNGSFSPGSSSGIPQTGQGVAQQTVNQKRTVELRLKSGFYTEDELKGFAKDLLSVDDNVVAISSAQNDASRRGVINE